jgi:hypothetical protein
MIFNNSFSAENIFLRTHFGGRLKSSLNETLKKNFVKDYRCEAGRDENSDHFLPGILEK